MSGGAHQVFISYRREETAAYAGRLYDAMVARFGEDNVFMDVEMDPGVDFVERIDDVLSGCTALIVVIGPHWLDVAGPAREPRLRDPGDFVRREVAAALRRADVTVIPALVGGATMPPAHQLPEELHPLTRRNALELSHGRWRYDVGRLDEVLDRLITRSHPPQRRAAAARGRGATSRFEGGAVAARLLLEGAAIAAGAAFAGRCLGDLPEMSGTSAAAEIAELLVQRGIAWGLVGLAMAPWLGWRLGRSDFGYLTVLGLLCGLIAGIVGGAIFGLPHKLPAPSLEAAEQPGWGVLSLAATGAVLGAMLGSLWQPHRVAFGLLGGLAGGAVCRLALNEADPFENGLPGIAYSFAVLGAGVASGALLALIGAEIALSYRSSLRATEAGSR
ncbi:MAG: toll/interleukin-1 receptor domain-containing protein [Solirubrobacterales bacterium]